MTAILSNVKPLIAPAALGYAGARVAGAMTASRGAFIRIGAGVALVGVGFYLGTKLLKV